MISKFLSLDLTSSQVKALIANRTLDYLLFPPSQLLKIGTKIKQKYLVSTLVFLPFYRTLYLLKLQT